MSKGNHNNFSFWTRRWLAFFIFATISVVALGWGSGSPAYLAVPQASAEDLPSAFRIGEKLSYNVSFGKFANAAFAETSVVSRGKLSGREAVEIRGRVKTLEMVSAAFFMVDESRTVYAAPDSGLPLYISSNSHNTILPQEKISNYLSQTASGYDFLSVLFKARDSAGAGTFPLFENEQFSSVTFIPTNAERVKTNAGEFDTVVSLVQSPALIDVGIRDLKINFTTDEARIPLQIRFKTDKGDFRALVTAIALPGPLPAADYSPQPSPTIVPRLTPTQDQYIDNRQLLPELGFQIGEVLEYGISGADRSLAQLTFHVRERRQFQNTDSLLLTATITSVEPVSNNFVLGEAARVRVDPETLTPTWAAMQFTSAFAGLKQTVTFDSTTGVIKFGPPQGVDAPIGTHNLLSLFYAMRSFNLRPSKNPDNPVNDTRVAVFWEDRPYVFTLRPSNPAEITINGEKVMAQMISIHTANPELDKLALKVWLRTADRVPVRMTAGPVQADLFSKSSSFR
ncbi:hypothetical protein BH20ACI2_BH20ACI2_04290 [soil metagenome]